MNYKIIELSERPDLLKEAITYIWKYWGEERNFKFYKDCISNSGGPPNSLPKFFIVLHEEKIIATYALLTNDLISRQDLMPWLACMYIDKDFRKKGIAEFLFQHSIEETKKRRFDKLYLSADLKGNYEKKGWQHFATGYNLEGKEKKIFAKSIF